MAQRGDVSTHGTREGRIRRRVARSSRPARRDGPGADAPGSPASPLGWSVGGEDFDLVPCDGSPAFPLGWCAGIMPRMGGRRWRPSTHLERSSTNWIRRADLRFSTLSIRNRASSELDRAEGQVGVSQSTGATSRHPFQGERSRKGGAAHLGSMSTAITQRKLIDVSGLRQVARPGFEPGLNDPESFVLPLHHRAVEANSTVTLMDVPTPGPTEDTTLDLF